jgi:hypothetical protein
MPHPGWHKKPGKLPRAVKTGWFVYPDLRRKGSWFGCFANEAFWVSSISRIENALPLLEDQRTLSVVNHRWRQQGQARVAMFLVVPTKEPLREGATNPEVSRNDLGTLADTLVEPVSYMSEQDLDAA